MSLLSANSVVAGYGAHDEILKGLSIHVRDGEIVAILGPNGAGKSTLLKAIAGLIAPKSGSIEVGGASIGGLEPREVSRLGVVYVAQESNVFPSLSVEENLDVGGFLEPTRIHSRIRSILDQMPVLADKRRAKARTLSGGQRQLLAMAMALMIAPRVLLLDEPTAGLSPVAADDLLKMVTNIRSTGVAICLVEQNAVRALGVADRAYVLVDGRNAIDGDAGELLKDVKTRQLFLGQS